MIQRTITPVRWPRDRLARLTLPATGWTIPPSPPPEKTSERHVDINVMSISALITSSLLLLFLLSWRKRAALRTCRRQAEQETKILALLVDHERFKGRSLGNLEQALVATTRTGDWISVNSWRSGRWECCALSSGGGKGFVSRLSWKPAHRRLNIESPPF